MSQLNLNKAIYFIQDLEKYMGKERIEFLIHKSYWTKKVIDSLAVSV